MTGRLVNLRIMVPRHGLMVAARPEPEMQIGAESRVSRGHHGELLSTSPDASLSLTSSVSGPRPADAGWRRCASNRIILLLGPNIMIVYKDILSITGPQ